MTKKELPKYVYRRGRNLHIYYCRYGKCQRMHSLPGTAEFAAEYAMMLKGRPPAPKRTIKGLIQKYMESERWPELAKNTRISYLRHFRYFEEVMGTIDPATLRTVHVYEMRDALKETPTDANRKVGALVTLLGHAIRIGWLDRNVAIGVMQLKGRRPPRKPWPADKINAFRDAADAQTRLVFELLLGTGQRIGDVLRMQWGDLEDGGIALRQTKTGTVLWIPVTEALAAILAQTPRIGATIVAQKNGSPVSYSLAWKWIMEARKLDSVKAEAWDIHSLRHSAASEISALPGMTEEHVKAITGHSSSEMVKLYAGAAAQKARAKEAQKARGKNENIVP
ncbi:tyrosine-type recombinase/integrase [Paracoccus aminophilus]|uniref:Phage integrase n=1 Tax=Paracoccus aminophilus JCM 7686 TaxID=1367847 RepID=S5YA82_PARAH|nr:tyrosine-type recombinase/integrase [Paracoccus aminophilus]AGT08328.1 phage integrase [Paracoccus aminophilus JCM 7686]